MFAVSEIASENMFEKITDQLKHNHMLHMIICCAAPFAIAFTLPLVGLTGGIWYWAAAAACPLSMGAMMYFMHKDQKKDGKEACH